MIVHFETCNSSYPEKPDGELPQAIQEIYLEDSEVVRQCVDCGAFEIVYRRAYHEAEKVKSSGHA